MHDQIEYVAQAFYVAEGDGQSWDSEPEILKDEFRRYARKAVALLNQKHEPQEAGLPLAA